jgi:glycosyltransferase involved in cell wall biosynthesis
MASGLAPVAAKIGGATGIIQEGISGLFAKPLSGEDLARGVERLLDDKRLRKELAMGAVHRAQTFTWETILAQLFDSYQSVVYERKRHESRAA